MARRRTRRSLLNDLRSPLARYVLATLTLLALATEQLIPALVVGAAAAYAWKA